MTSRKDYVKISDSRNSFFDKIHSFRSAFLIYFCLITSCIYIFISGFMISGSSQCRHYKYDGNEKNKTEEYYECKNLDEKTILSCSFVGAAYLFALCAFCIHMSVYVKNNYTSYYTFVINYEIGIKLVLVVHFVLWSTQTFIFGYYCYIIYNNLPNAVNDQYDLYIRYFIVYIITNVQTYIMGFGIVLYIMKKCIQCCFKQKPTHGAYYVVNNDQDDKLVSV